MGIGCDDGCGNRGDAHVGGAKQGLVFQHKSEGFGQVEGAMRDGVAELEAVEVVAAHMHADG